MELLKLLSETNGVSGNEENIADIIRNQIGNCADEVYSDNLGNLIVHKAGSGPKLMVSAHMDEIGIMVTYIEDNGFLRFAAVGGVDVYNAVNRHVVFENGTVGIISREMSVDIKKDLNFSKLYIDIGAGSGEEARSRVSVGDTAAFISDFVSDGRRIVGKALDNRIGVYILVNVIKKCRTTGFDTYFVFTTQEEIGLRGAKTAAFAVNPDYSLSVDVTDSGDTPNCPKNSVKLGAGPCIKVMDKSVICHPKIRRALEECAAELNIPFQHEVLSYGGTDAGSIHISGDGIVTGAISVPLRYMHTQTETANMDDINQSIELMTAFVQSNHIK